jgi:hypothetical protein
LKIQPEEPNYDFSSFKEIDSKFKEFAEKAKQ